MFNKSSYQHVFKRYLTNQPKYFNNQFSNDQRFTGRSTSASTKGTSVFKRLFKSLVYIEVGLFIGSYILWKRMNDSQDFRLYMKNNYPSILEGK
jgi:hypothetical protein